MKKIILLLFIFIQIAHASSYKIDSSHSNINFTVTHLVISKVTGQFNAFDGVITWDPSNLKASSLIGTVQTSSINTNNTKRDGHLTSKDFFNAKKYPQIKLTSTSIRKKRNHYEVTADLSIKNIRKKIRFPLYVKGPIKDNYGNTKLAFSANFTIDRFDYNLNWNAALETGELVVDRDVAIAIDIQANKR